MNRRLRGGYRKREKRFRTLFISTSNFFLILTTTPEFFFPRK